ncbi:MAG: hypothetical protein QNJ20_05330 [Paracoccaceae bacterium]|nr:hypothetical protein [Paracoccaceae bacterium]
MPERSDADTALAALKESGFEPNAHWERAHEIAQAHEGDHVFDAIHAFCHRIEGDTHNAAYWDRQAGTSFGGQGHAIEYQTLADFIRSA